ncbi:MAG: site-2 protease family protein [Puniceicoccales bacterium]|nr:site-2 protease family protein [Puniceicoccales bacterium]
MSIRNLEEAFICYLWFLLALAIHEWGHAWIAERLGDDRPRIDGRVTLNPLAHISLVGTVIIPLLGFLCSPDFAMIGWGRPVVVNSDNFKNKRLGDILCTFAGPFLNLVFSFLVSLLSFFLFKKGNQSLSYLCSIGVMTNASLGLFNLIPIPPLDGANILKSIIGMKETTFIVFSKWGFIILLFLINSSVFTHYFSEANYFLLNFYWKLCHILLE